MLLLYFIGHLLGDYYMQSNTIAQDKVVHLKSLLLHCLMYTLMMIAVILPIYSPVLLLSSLFIALTHFLFDWIKFVVVKYRAEHKKEARPLSTYVIDQILHIALIVLTSMFIANVSSGLTYYPFLSDLCFYFGLSLYRFFAWIVALLVVLKPTSITIKIILATIDPRKEEKEEPHPSTGMMIGHLERLIILLLLCVGQYASIGLVLTAKSVARYNKISNDKEFAEYYLIGTLFSTLVSIVTFLLLLT
jgi:hypothetical protein